jgi:hypothetical protein
MNRVFVGLQFGLVILLAVAPLGARAQDHDYLTSAEVDKLRDAQDPSERIKVYLSFQLDRLNRIEAGSESNGDVRGSVDDLLNQYISIDNELKDWIQYQYDHEGDMRKGLRTLLDEGPKQLEILRHIQSSPGPDAKDYEGSLRDAIADMNDTLDGATQALAVQQKKFPEMADSAKADARAMKKERKEQEKLNKKEREMRNKHRKNDNPDDSGGN